MSGFRVPEQAREQLVLWSSRLEDAIPVDHPVRLLDELLRSSAFSAEFRDWEGDYSSLEGQPAYHPRELTALVIYGALNRLRSSRQLEAAAYNRLDVLWLLSGQHPDHSTIAAFVNRHGARLKRIKKQVLKIGMLAGVVKLDHVAVDGTKIEADAGRGSVLSEEKIRAMAARAEEAVAAWEAEWAANEARETAVLGDSVPWAAPEGRALSQRLARKKRELERLNRAIEAVERRRAEAEEAGSAAPRAIAVTSDPDSRSMRDKEGRSKPNYNAQLAVDSGSGMILGEAVNDRAEDSGQLTPLLEEVRENCGRLPAEASADSQYNTGPELAAIEQMSVVVYVPDAHQRSSGALRPLEQSEALAAVAAGQELSAAQWPALPRDAKGFLDKSAFVYDANKNEYRCPAGRPLPLLRMSCKSTRAGRTVRQQYRCTSCSSCPQAPACCRKPTVGRIVNRDQYEEHRERMRIRMASPEGRARYRLRKQTVEPCIGRIKHNLGVRRFLRRSLAKVATEWALLCTAVNVGVLLRHWDAVKAVL
jgi:transposase